MRTEQEVEDQIDLALLAAEAETTEGYQLGFLRGVRVALGWVIEEDDEPPIEAAVEGEDG